MAFNNHGSGKAPGNILSHLPSLGADGNKIDEEMIFSMISKVIGNDYKHSQLDSDPVQKKIDRPFSAPPPGLSFAEQNDENKVDLLYDPYYYVYYYSQKPLDPRLPKPLMNQWEAKIALNRINENKEDVQPQDFLNSQIQNLDQLHLSDNDEDVEMLNQISNARFSPEHTNQIFAPRPMEGSIKKVPSNTTSPLGYRQSPGLINNPSTIGIQSPVNPLTTAGGYQAPQHQLNQQRNLTQQQNKNNYVQMPKPEIHRPKPVNFDAQQAPQYKNSWSGRVPNSGPQINNQRGYNQNYQNNSIPSGYNQGQGMFNSQTYQSNIYQQPANQNNLYNSEQIYPGATKSLLPNPIQLKQSHSSGSPGYNTQMQGSYNNSNYWQNSPNPQMMQNPFTRTPNQGPVMNQGFQDMNGMGFGNNSYSMANNNRVHNPSAGGGGNFNKNIYGLQNKSGAQYGQTSPSQVQGGNYYNMGSKYGTSGSNNKANYHKQNQNTHAATKEKIDYSSLQGNIFELSKDQNGSRQVQQYFEQGGEEEKRKVWVEIEDKAFVLMKDVFGNYVIQKILEKGDEKMKILIYEKMKDHVLDLTMHTYGCRVVQKALEVLKSNSDIQAKIIREFKGQVLQIVQDQNGNHVIQKSFEAIYPKNMEFVIEEIINNLDTLAFHSSGCRVIQKILEFSPVEKTVPILNKLMDNIIKLCECQYGNYIMQHILEKGPEKEKEKLLETIKVNFVSLSSNKFASNVTEKSVQYSHPSFRKEVLQLLMKPSPSNPNDCGLFQMMKDAFGNYVVQRLYEQSDQASKNKFYHKISQSPEAIEDLKKSNYGKHVLSCIEKSHNESLNKI